MVVETVKCMTFALEIENFVLTHSSSEKVSFNVSERNISLYLMSLIFINLDLLIW